MLRAYIDGRALCCAVLRCVPYCNSLATTAARRTGLVCRSLLEAHPELQAVAGGPPACSGQFSSLRIHDHMACTKYLPPCRPASPLACLAPLAPHHLNHNCTALPPYHPLRRLPQQVPGGGGPGAVRLPGPALQPPPLRHRGLRRLLHGAAMRHRAHDKWREGGLCGAWPSMPTVLNTVGQALAHHHW